MLEAGSESPFPLLQRRVARPRRLDCVVLGSMGSELTWRGKALKVVRRNLEPMEVGREKRQLLSEGTHTGRADLPVLA